MNEVCSFHADFAKDIRTLVETAIINKTHIDEIYKNIKELNMGIKGHINEAEKEGGIRDRVRRLEMQRENLDKQISAIKQGYWKVGLGAGFVGALFGHLTPELVNIVVRFITKYAGGG